MFAAMISSKLCPAYEAADRGAVDDSSAALSPHLLKFVHDLQDVDGHDVDLFYLRDRAGREVDFLITASGRPWLAVEAKLSDIGIDSSIRYFQQRLKIPFAYQVVLESRRDFVEDGVRCVPAADFLAALS